MSSGIFHLGSLFLLTQCRRESSSFLCSLSILSLQPVGICPKACIQLSMKKKEAIGSTSSQVVTLFDMLPLFKSFHDLLLPCWSQSGIYLWPFPFITRACLMGCGADGGPGQEQPYLLEGGMEILGSPVSPLLVPWLHHSPQRGLED